MAALERADVAVRLRRLGLRPGAPAAVASALRWLRRAVLPFALLVGVWWAVKLVLRLDSTVLPSPLETASSAVPLLQRGILVDYVTSSLDRIAVASLLGVSVGVPVGLLLGSNRWLSLAFRPYLMFFQALSGIAWLPMVLVWFGFTETSIQAVILYTVLFPVAFNTMAGVRTVPGQLANAVRVLGASRTRLVRDVWLPGAMPGVLVGARLGIAYGWRALIAGEMVVGTGGIGYLLFQARSFHLTSRIILGMVVIGLLWTFIDLGFLRPLERATVERWGMVQR
jgi:NitT/TauT family transport system permease protein/taurine transport system permease protein